MVFCLPVKKKKKKKERKKEKETLKKFGLFLVKEVLGSPITDKN